VECNGLFSILQKAIEINMCSFHHLLGQNSCSLKTDKKNCSVLVFILVVILTESYSFIEFIILLNFMGIGQEI
jgi:hypothetical protein